MYERNSVILKERNNQLKSAFGVAYSWFSAGIIAAVCLFIIGTVVFFGFEKLSISFLITPPSASARDLDGSGILTPLIGTLILTVLGIVVALPFSLATAVYLCFYSKKGLFKDIIETAIDILAGVPTVVIALFSLSIFVLPQFGFLSTMIENADGVSEKAYGKSFLVASITMAVMILPFVIKSITEALKRVPIEYISGSYALGATKWRTILKIVLLCAKPGIITGTILGMGRIIGDTAIVWLTLGGTLRMTGTQPWYLPQNWLSTVKNTGSTLTTYIFYTSPAGEGNTLSTAFAASLALIIIIMILNILTVVLGRLGTKEINHD